MLSLFFYNSLNLSNVGGFIERDRQICHREVLVIIINNNNNKGLYCFFKAKIHAENQEHLH